MAAIQAEANAEIRRVLLDRYGWDRYVLESGAQIVHADDYGTLYRAELEGDEPIAMVSVVNSTADTDGSFKPYLIPVNPACRTAHDAVASTFGLTAKTYKPVVET